ncbi:hypothetical protein B9Z19DRAFT_992108 [Tuber borchii]|uniref:Uncharacterized protein n=1 Tax=Tuber borchii TaxID=42251 RepID=A0A2T6ZKV0_TUBBO|nr:hypothetical protein B9Z19DRAFT_992108 [Tuber borchii]
MSPQPVQLPPQKVIEKAGVRILCIANVSGNLRSLNELAMKAKADHILHTGNFGFYDDSSLERIADKTLRHVAQYSPLLEDGLKKRIQNSGPSSQSIKQLFGQVEHPLSELPLFLNKKCTLDVPVYTVCGVCEDVRVLEKFRSGEYKINNLHIIDEASSRLLDVGGVKLRLLGLGGAVVMHRLFDKGEGRTTIAGGQGTVWATLLQLGELVDTANRVYDPTETRIFVTHASPARVGLLNQLSVTLKADFSISAGLNFRYGTSYNEFSLNPTLDHYRGMLASSKASFNDVWESVKGEVLPTLLQNEAQQGFLNNVLDIVEQMPTSANGGNPFGGPAPNTAPGTGQVDESAFKNMRNFDLADAASGWLVLEVEGGSIATEMRARGFNFAHKSGQGAPTTQQQQQQQQPTPLPAQAGPPVTPKPPATPRPVPSGPANSTATPVATPLRIAAAEKPSTSNRTRTESPVFRVVPKIDTPAMALVAAPTRPQHQEASSTQDRLQPPGLYVTGVKTVDAVRALFPSEVQRKIQRIEKRHPRGRPHFFVYFESCEVAREVIEQLPEDFKTTPPLGEYKVLVQLMENFSPSSNSRPGMSGSKWARGTGTDRGNTSESDNSTGSKNRGGYRDCGRGSYGLDRGGGLRGRGSDSIIIQVGEGCTGGSLLGHVWRYRA